MVNEVQRVAPEAVEEAERYHRKGLRPAEPRAKGRGCGHETSEACRGPRGAWEQISEKECGAASLGVTEFRGGSPRRRLPPEPLRSRDEADSVWVGRSRWVQLLFLEQEVTSGIRGAGRGLAGTGNRKRRVPSSSSRSVEASRLQNLTRVRWPSRVAPSRV